VFNQLCINYGYQFVVWIVQPALPLVSHTATRGYFSLLFPALVMFTCHTIVMVNIYPYSSPYPVLRFSASLPRRHLPPLSSSSSSSLVCSSTSPSSTAASVIADRSHESVESSVSLLLCCVQFIQIERDCSLYNLLQAGHLYRICKHQCTHNLC